MKRSIIQLCLLAICVVLAGCAGSTIIVNTVPEREANEIVVLLASKGIEATKSPAPVSAVAGATTETMWDISVPASQITESLAILNQAALPSVKGTTLLDLFGTSGLVPSDLQDRIRYQEGLSSQLAATIRKMDGIIDANVQITFPSTEEETDVPLTASVYVKHRGVLDNPNSLLITKIKRLVSSALPGLTLENVSVVADRALISDISLPEMTMSSEQDKDYTSIWTIIVAKESTARFRLIFYIFFFVLFIFVCALAWLVWKIYPAMRSLGGFKYLVSSKQMQAPTPGTFPEETIPEAKEEETNEEK